VPQDLALYEPGKFNYASVFVLKDSPIGEFPFKIPGHMESFDQGKLNQKAKSVNLRK
jgi:hypothetical protein